MCLYECQPFATARSGDYLDAAAPQRADGVNLHADPELCVRRLFVSAVPAGTAVSTQNPIVENQT